MIADDLFDWSQGSQPENLKRVKARIGAAIRVFYRSRANSPSFHADDLRNHVRAFVGQVAPGSPDRILRDMRQHGELSYKVISRRDSLYLFLYPPRDI